MPIQDPNAHDRCGACKRPLDERTSEASARADREAHEIVGMLIANLDNLGELSDRLWRYEQAMKVAGRPLYDPAED